MQLRENHSGYSSKPFTFPDLGELMAEVRLTMEEYRALLRLQSSERESEGTRLSNRSRSINRKRKGKPDPKMARALRKANQLGRKKSGGFKKGYSQAKIMKKAHQLRRKM